MAFCVSSSTSTAKSSPACDPHIGLLHRGTEKLIEHKTYLQAIPYFDRLDYVAPMNEEHAFAMAIEKLLGLEVPRRGQYIRVLYCEIGRILNHMLNVTTQALDVGALTPPLWGFEEREKLMVFYERASGSRMHAAYFRARRRASGPAAGPRRGHLRLLRIFPEGPRRHRRAAGGKPHLQAAQCGHRQCQPRTGPCLGMTGVMLRSTGLAWDLRRAQPYECYSDLDFEIPVGKNGDCFDRYVMRIEEMRQANAIMKQCIEKMPSGPVVVGGQQGGAAPPRRDEELDGSAHPPLQALHRRLPRARGEVYAAVEAPKGEFGVYLVSDGSNKPYRCKIRAPFFAHLQALDALSRGHMLADVSAIIGSIDVVFGEVDQ